MNHLMPLRVEMLFFVTLLLAYLHIVIGFIELVSEHGRQDTEFRLTCRELSAHIAVKDASFTSSAPDSASTPRSAPPNNTTATAVIVRQAINHRCSGRNHCSFILHADCPGSKQWGPGELFIKYACMPESTVTRFCNLDITIPPGGGAFAQGFITSPGYPRFYIGTHTCRWRVLAPEQQRVELTLLDVSLSSAPGPGGSCEDVLHVADINTGIMLLPDTCTERVMQVVSNGSGVEVAVMGREGSLVPKRGVLLYYRAVECPTMTAPVDGYLVHRNVSVAEYRCCVGFVFPETRARDITLYCLINHWDRILPTHCILLQNLTQVEEVTDGQSTMTDSTHLIDVIIPSLLIAGLLVGNAIIVFFIYEYKKRKHVEILEEELDTIVSAEQSSHVP